MLRHSSVYQCSLVRYNTLFPLCLTSSQMWNKIYLFRPLKYVGNLYSIWSTQFKIWQGKAWAHLSYTIHTGNRSLESRHYDITLWYSLIYNNLKLNLYLFLTNVSNYRKKVPVHVAVCPKFQSSQTDRQLT
jgi:hypothetical protein